MLVACGRYGLSGNQRKESVELEGYYDYHHAQQQCYRVEVHGEDGLFESHDPENNHRHRPEEGCGGPVDVDPGKAGEDDARVGYDEDDEGYYL